MTTYTSKTLPNNIPALQTGTANDGRMLIRIGTGDQAQSALEDIRSRLPAGWSADVYAASGIDAVITHHGELSKATIEKIDAMLTENGHHAAWEAGDTAHKVERSELAEIVPADEMDAAIEYVGGVRG